MKKFIIAASLLICASCCGCNGYSYEYVKYDVTNRWELKNHDSIAIDKNNKWVYRLGVSKEGRMRYYPAN